MSHIILVKISWMVAITSILLLLALAGCGKSEINKCVDAFMKEYDVKCTAYSPEPKTGESVPSCNLKGAREEEEASVRLGCLKASVSKN